MHHLHIVATCTDRKRGTIADELRLRALPAGDPGVRASAWWRRLDGAAPLARVQASHVYVGESWRQAQALATQVGKAGWRVDLWVTSAGYGLLSERTPITPYSCTFAEGSPDQVALGQPAGLRLRYNQDWWSTLAELRARHEPAPTSLAALAARDPKATMLVLASPDYVRALHGDLAAAAERLRRPEQLSIVTSGAGWRDDPLGNNVLSVDDRTRSVLGGTMQGLHARAALELLGDLSARHEPFTAALLRDKYVAMVGDTPRPEKPLRTPMTDAEVVAFLEAELAKNPKAGWTLLLRTLRGSGRACEQKRFRRLHAEAQAAVRGET